MAISVRRAMTRANLDSTSYDLRAGGGGPEHEQSVSKQAVAALFALDQFTDHLPELEKARAHVQETRTVSDLMIWRLFGQVDAPIYHSKMCRRAAEPCRVRRNMVVTHVRPRLSP